MSMWKVFLMYLLGIVDEKYICEDLSRWATEISGKPIKVYMIPGLKLMFGSALAMARFNNIILSHILTEVEESTVKSIMLHEIGHIINNDIPKLYSINTVCTIITLFVWRYLRKNLGYGYLKVYLFGYIISLPFMLMCCTFSKKCEFEADFYTKVNGYGKELGNLFQKVSEYQKGRTKTPWDLLLRMYHPDPAERSRRLLN